MMLTWLMKRTLKRYLNSLVLFVLLIVSLLLVISIPGQGRIIT